MVSLPHPVLHEKQTNSLHVCQEDAIAADDDELLGVVDLQTARFLFKKLEETCVFLKANNTPLKFNIAPETWWLEDYFPLKSNFAGASC